MMAQRKDMMRIIRQDAGFSAKLGFGESKGAVRNERVTTPPDTADETVATFSGSKIILSISLLPSTPDGNA
jgi:hypothetical protein